MTKKEKTKLIVWSCIGVAVLAAMCQFVHEQDPKYSCVVKVEQSYASAAHEK